MFASFKLPLLMLTLLVMVFLTALPDKAASPLLHQYSRLPAVDLHALAKNRWEQNEQTGALAILAYIQENQAAKGKQAELQREAYLNALHDERPLLAKLLVMQDDARKNQTKPLSAWTALTLDNTLRGQLLQQFGENQLITALSEEGIMNTVFPPPAASTLALLAAAQKASALNQTIVEEVLAGLEAVTQYDDSIRRGIALTHLKNALLPLVELAKNSPDWNWFNTLLKHASTLDEVSRINQLMRDLHKQSLILPSLGHLLEAFPIQAGVILQHVRDYGKNGISDLYAAIPKGEAGLDFTLEHPGFTPPPATQVEQSGTWHGITQAWQTHLIQHPYLHWLRWAVLGGLFGVLVFLTLPPEKQMSGRTGFRLLAVSGMFSLLFVLFAGLQTLYNHDSPAPATPSYVAGGSPVPAQAAPIQKQGENITGLSFIALLVQLLCGLWGWRKIHDIRFAFDSAQEPTEVCLSRLRNYETYLDVPLYAGLFMSIIGFILFSAGVDGGRLFAYLSTGLGIATAFSLRIFYLVPLRQRLIYKLAQKKRTAAAKNLIR